MWEIFDGAVSYAKAIKQQYMMVIINGELRKK
jgi:hypothetical protein